MVNSGLEVNEVLLKVLKTSDKKKLVSMAVILQVDYTQVFTIIGLIIAFIAGSTTNLISDSITRRRLRRAAYKEIDVMYFTLKNAARRLEEELGRVTTIKGYTPVLKEIYSILQFNLRADAYKYLKAQPALSLGIKDISAIYNMHFRFSAFPVACEIDGVNPAFFETHPLPQGLALKSACESVRGLAEHILKHDLDQKLLLKLANPAQREELKELFQTLPAEEKEEA